MNVNGRWRARHEAQSWLMRSVLYSQFLGIEEPFIELLIEEIVTLEDAFSPHLRQQGKLI